ncbi:MAG: bifunctional lysylphosphatidylglycerol synthetase/lysine--tRNA ligase LysX [Propionibacteriaceae bacterium]
MSRLFFLAAAILVAQALFPAVAWFGLAADIFSTLVFPIDSFGVGLAAFAVLLGLALARRKRVAWVVALVGFSAVVLIDLIPFVALVATIFSSETIQVENQYALARFAFNLATASAIVITLVHYRGEFEARRPPGSVRTALVTLVVGLVVTFGAGLALVTAFPGALGRPRGRLAWVSRRIGDSFNGNTQVLVGPPSWISTVVGVMVGLSLFAAVLMLVRSQRQAAYMTAEEEPVVRALVAQSGHDSLAYFATRRDKSVVFGPRQRAAVTYRVELGVCLASSDPIGPPDHWPGAIAAWQEQVNRFGWTPAVIGASELGATAYARAGLRVIRIGDEAVLEPADFTIEGREMRPVRQAVQRLQKLGYTIRVRRHADLEPAELKELIDKVDSWRDTENERGFSMALGRLGDPADGACLMVEALFPERREGSSAADGPPEVAGILSFVPWGNDGFSLDVMRRSPRAHNGVTELMVAGLMAASPSLGIHRVSLNFAVFRSAFEEGARIGAGPVIRLWRRLLLVASRWWQIESLFRSNVKYRPQWEPRFLCFAETRDIALVGAASGVAEGFIDLPGFLRPPEPPATGYNPVVLAVGPSGRLEAPHPPAAVDLAGDLAPVVRVPEQTRLRMDVRQAMIDAGEDPYPVTFRPDHVCAALRLGEDAATAGRVLRIRDHGGVVFVTVRDWSGDAQLMLTQASTGCAAMEVFRRQVDLGDHVGAEGTGALSELGELSLEVRRWTLTSKALRPLPDKYRGISDPETRVRQRYLDLAVNPTARRQLAARSAIIHSVRDTLGDLNYLEVETPILQTVHGGANARPFTTHINAYDLDLYLRIAPELYLKRLMVGGVDRIFEIGRNFRNEGADATHNPEFTMLEAYAAYGDYDTMREVARQLVTRAAAATGSTVVQGTSADGTRHEVDLAEPWPVVTVNDAVSAAAGQAVTADTDVAALRALCGRLGIAHDPNWTRGLVLLELYEHLVEDRTVRPTFYTDFPAEVSPLTRQHRVDPRLAERWDLVAFGAEIGTAYSELVDPVEQRARLTAQSLQAAGGDPEAMALDDDFLIALEYAMPPSGGLGMGLDRLVMMLTQTSIRETITFPLVRPRR